MYLENSPFVAVSVSEIAIHEDNPLRIGEESYLEIDENEIDLEHILSFEEGKLELSQAGESFTGSYECRKGEVVIYMDDLLDEVLELSLDLSGNDTGVILFQGQYYANPNMIRVVRK